MKLSIPALVFVVASSTLSYANAGQELLKDPDLVYTDYTPKSSDLIIPRSQYLDHLEGFWLAQSIANWTGLVTEMDKVGNIGEFQTGDFYTRSDWGKPDQASIWGEGVPSDLSLTIDFVFRGKDEIWGSDDDTDIEYMYQYLMYTEKTSVLSAQQIRDGWLKHIKVEEENYLWVSNQQAFDLMREGVLPPATGDPDKNEHYEMIDAQLTTEIFGLFAPARPDVARKLAYLPIRTTARDESAEVSEFYVTMYSLAAHSLAENPDPERSFKERTQWMANEARKQLPDNHYPAKMYDFVKSQYEANVPWEETRDELHQKYQVRQEDGYDITSKDIYCNGCFAAGINFAASLVSLFYGEGDLKNTIKIAALAGWDSDNPAATWGGLLGFMIGKSAVEETFGRTFSDRFNIHRTRQNFPNDGIDTFENMAKTGIYIIDRVVQEQIGGGVDLNKNIWYIPGA